MSFIRRQYSKSRLLIDSSNLLRYIVIIFTSTAKHSRGQKSAAGRILFNEQHLNCLFTCVRYPYMPNC